MNIIVEKLLRMLEKLPLIGGLQCVVTCLVHLWTTSEMSRAIYSIRDSRNIPSTCSLNMWIKIIKSNQFIPSSVVFQEVAKNYHMF